MNNQCKRKNRTNLIIYVLFLSILTAIAVSGTFARYTSSQSGIGEAQVAAWRFNVEGLDTTTLTRTDLAQTVTDGLLAPGTEGYFAIGIDAYGAEVAIDYEIEVFNITNKPRNLKFYTNSTYTTEIAGVKNEIENEDGTMEVQTTYAIKGHMTLDEVLNESTAKRTVRIYWQWPYETENGDEIDTADSLIGSMELDIRVVGTQSMGVGEVTGPTYEINYDLGGGTGDISSQNKQEGVDTSITTLIPTKTGYTFLGWATEANATKATYVAGEVFTVDENTTLYAVWEKEVTVTFSYYGGTTSITETIRNTETTAKVTAPGALGTPSGYTFNGWSTSSVANPSSKITSTGTISTANNITYYASYTYPVTITFNANGGTGTVLPLKGTAYMNYVGTKVGASITIPSNAYTKSGYQFTGWSSVDTGTGTSYTVERAYEFEEDTTIYARWTVLNAGTITFTNGYSISSSASSGSSDSDTSTSSTVPSGCKVSYSYNGGGNSGGGTATIYFNNVQQDYFSTGTSTSGSGNFQTTTSGTIKLSTTAGSAPTGSGGAGIRITSIVRISDGAPYTLK